MVDHEFGGSWTEEKLRRLKDYLAAYRQIFKSQSWCTNWYVDAFAGTGSRKVADAIPIDFGEDSHYDPDASAYLDGSARIALGLPSPFDRYLFIEKSRQRVDELKWMIESDFPHLADRCTFQQEDANVAIARWAKERMGVSVEDQRVLHRVDDLREVPAYVRFLSCEPLIGPLSDLPLDGIHWVIVGGESGPGARPMPYEWVEQIRNRCNTLDVPFFFKQWGGIQKKRFGRTLNGRVFNEMPPAVPIYVQIQPAQPIAG